jgi:hypothetical protein
MKALLISNKILYTLILAAFGFTAYSQDDAGVIAVISPSQANNLTMGLSYEVTITIENFGSSSIQNIPVKFVVGVNSVLDEVYTGTIAAGATSNYTFTDSLVITSTLVGSGFAETNLISDTTNTGNDRLNTTYTYGVAGLNDNRSESGLISAYPNPVVDKLSIKLQGSGVVCVSIYDIAGKRVKIFNLFAAAGVQDLDVSDLISGVYVVQVNSEKGTTSKKFVK